MLLNLLQLCITRFASSCAKLLLFASISITVWGCTEETEKEKTIIQRGNVTSEIELLGNPLKAKYKDDTERVYARNIWDIHAFDGKIYFGGGNSSNESPASNAGPADLWTYNPATKEFKIEYTVTEEQIHIIREFDNQLYIPGHDSRESWALGNFYRLESGVWKKHRTIPNGIHVYDIYKWGNKLIAAIGTGTIETSAIQISDDDGKTWKNPTCFNENGTENKCECYASRIYNIFTISNKLVAVCPIAFTLDAGESSFNRLTFDQTKALFQQGTVSRIERSVVFALETVYIIGYTVNDHQYQPVSLLHAKDVDNVFKVELPDGAIPYDLLVKEGKLFALISTKSQDNTFRNSVLYTSDLNEWKEIFYFEDKSFARSFEYLDGKFYFGLGCDTSPLSPVSGNILSLSYPL